MLSLATRNRGCYFCKPNLPLISIKSRKDLELNEYEAVIDYGNIFQIRVGDDYIEYEFDYCPLCGRDLLDAE